MTDQKSAFISFMEKHDCGPERADAIISDDKWHDYVIAGDKPGKKKGFYKLAVEDGFGYGCFGDRRRGDVIGWHSKAAKSWTDEEKAAWKARVAAQKAAGEAEEAARHEAGHTEATALWASGGAVSGHPYLERKGISGRGLRVAADDLLVPLKDAAGKLWNVQRITPDGDKWFLKGRKKACYAAIVGDGTGLDTIALVEGYGTGWSVHEATGLGVVVCFDAGNLKAVGQDIRRKYPEARLVVCADNDTGGERNTGLDKGREAAGAIGGWCIWPDEGGDFNDMLLTAGTDAVKERILSVFTLQNEQADGSGDGPAHNQAAPDHHDELTPLEAYDDVFNRHQLEQIYAVPVQTDKNWRGRLVFKEDGGLKAGSLLNIEAFVSNHERYAGLFCYDEFAHEKIICRCPPWDDSLKFEPRVIEDEDITKLAIDLEALERLTPKLSDLHKIIDAIIKSTKRHPAREYFNRLKWDGESRLDTWLTYYCGAEFDNKDYLAAVGRKWLTAAVARVFEPGCKFDHIPIFEGPQNAGKSLMLRELATIHGRSYFDDTIRVSDLGLPQTVPKMQGVLIIEIAELSGFGRKDVNELKQAITTQLDRIVRKYRNEATYYARQFVFAGTINPLDGYLHDATGNRRFWPVRVGNKIDVDSLRRDKEQLWAEAVVRYREGEKLYLEDDTYLRAHEAQEERRTIDPWLPDIEAIANDRGFVPTKEIWEGLNIPKIQRRKHESDNIAKIMTTLGYEQTRSRIEGMREYGWRKK